MRNTFDRNHWSVRWDFQAELPNVVLYLRDFIQLETVISPHVPPALFSIDDPIDLQLSSTEIRLVTDAWLQLWELAVPRQPTNHADVTDALLVESRLLRGGTSFDRVVAEAPLLHDLASSATVLNLLQLARNRALQWNRSRRRECIAFGDRYLQETHAQVKSVAERVVDQLQLSPDFELTASITILDSEVEWWDLIRSGILLCTRVVAQDRSLFLDLLQETLLSASSLKAKTEWPEEIIIPKHKLPPSVLPQPVVLADNGKMVLICEGVIPYPDGFELNFKRTDDTTDTSTASLLLDPDWEHRWKNLSDRFNGLQLEVRFADGRKEFVTDLRREDRPGAPTVVRFDRDPSDGNSLWLWIMPLPPPGPVVVELSWPEQDITSVAFEFDGNLLLHE
ncbi:MAG: hypothetical protein ACYDHP_13075 [Ferrimicrobium sp.]